VTDLTNDEAYAQAAQLFNDGRLREAETICRQILSVQSKHADALHMLGLLAHRATQLESAVELVGAAVAIQPNNPVYLSNYGELLRAAGRLQEALGALQLAYSLDPNSLNLLHNYSLALRDAGRIDEALFCADAAIRQSPNWVEPRKVIVNLLISRLSLSEALPHAHQLINQLPNDAEAFCIFGRVASGLSMLYDAEIAFARAVELEPTSALYLNELGTVQQSLLKTQEAGDSWRKAIDCDPNFSWPYNNLAGVLKDIGRLDESIEVFRRGLEINPKEHSVRSNMLLSMHYSTTLDQATIFHEHRLWEESVRLFNPEWKTQPIVNVDRNPSRVLRIGYVSGDFRSHSVADFLEALWKQHRSPRSIAARLASDAPEFELYAYSDVVFSDNVTKSLRGYVDVWRDIPSVPFESVAEQIRADRIDILIDLAGHSANNRMPLFAIKSAPIQMSWLGYPDTTGLSTVDYRFTDFLADPPGMTEQFFIEQLIRLPHGFLCYHPTEGCPEPGPLPCDSSSKITLGCFNNFAKLNRPLIRLWKRLLDAIPEANLLLKATILGKGFARDVMSDYFADAGLDPHRVELIGAEPDFFSHIAHYRKVDIALDTFPYHGTTTTCEALWMGVPVVTLLGKVHTSRVGASVLNHAGLPELITETEDDYIQTVVDLARNKDRLRELRQTLRNRLTSSPLLDAPRFARDFESALRNIWIRYCEEKAD
jgi:predicted O-linked N-acetylglucosamine transferase (SPINDLY family)